MNRKATLQLFFVLTIALIMLIAPRTANSQSGIDKHYPGVYRPSNTPTHSPTVKNQMPNQETRDDLKKNLKVTILKDSVSSSLDSNGNKIVRFNIRLENKTGRTLTFYPRNILVYDTESNYTECRIHRSGDHPKEFGQNNNSANENNPSEGFKVTQDFDSKWSQKGKQPSPDAKPSDYTKRPTPGSSVDYTQKPSTYRTGIYMNSVSVLPRRTNEVTISCLLPGNKRPAWAVVKYGSYVVGKKRIGD
jgi:hypothetical protein